MVYRFCGMEYLDEENLNEIYKARQCLTWFRKGGHLQGEQY